MSGESRCTKCYERIKYNKEYNINYCEKHKICINCKNQDAYTLIGKHYCADCVEYFREAQKRSRERRKKENLEKYYILRRNQANNLYKKRKEVHRCTQCNSYLPFNYYKNRCPKCLSIMQAYKKKKRMKEGVNYPRGGNGYCWQCNKRPSIDGKKLCEECYVKACERAKIASKAKKRNRKARQPDFILEGE